MKGASLLHPLFPAEIPGITYQSVTHSRKTMNENPLNILGSYRQNCSLKQLYQLTNTVPPGLFWRLQLK